MNIEKESISYLKNKFINKIDYLKKNKPFNTTTKPLIIELRDTPPIPNAHKGQLSEVRNFFGDTDTLNFIIEQIAKTKNTTKEGLIKDIEFTIDGVKSKQDPSIILPAMGDSGRYKNQVPWLVVFEGVVITYLKNNEGIVAFTATEYAPSRKLGYFDWQYGSNGQHMKTMTHRALPNSLLLQNSWFGFKNFLGVKSHQFWNNDKIIDGGGWGMRMLGNERKPTPVIQPPIEEIENVMLVYKYGH